MSKNQSKPTKHSLSFTTEDEKVNKWIDNQHNTSLSLRLLIRSVINQSGYQDYPTYLSSLVSISGNSMPVKDNIENQQKEKPDESIGSSSSHNNHKIDYMGTGYDD